MEIMRGLGGKNSAVGLDGKACGTCGGFIGEGCGKEEGWSTHLSQRGVSAFNSVKSFNRRSFLVPDEESFPN